MHISRTISHSTRHTARFGQARAAHTGGPRCRGGGCRLPPGRGPRAANGKHSANEPTPKRSSHSRTRGDAHDSRFTITRTCGDTHARPVAPVSMRRTYPPRRDTCSSLWLERWFLYIHTYIPQLPHAISKVHTGVARPHSPVAAHNKVPRARTRVRAAAPTARCGGPANPGDTRSFRRPRGRGDGGARGGKAE